ncbi:FAD linked oxidase [Diplogelasinospora grovesii]|uniref:FAD linked oxidase n=1 Tax=Diplogelasinospora grovesii TaxID=303347 RepID=A0AAN6MXP4_9PEZI|nr:FAD linked oxidase [Diplogelasinospora grovesii]
MGKKSLGEFIAALRLTEGRAADLEARLAQHPDTEPSPEARDTTTSNIFFACICLEAALGANSVSTAPVKQTLVDENWSNACWLTPACIVEPNSASDVSKILTVIEQFQTPSAVRSGGHSPNPGWSSISQLGILIDLSRLNQIIVSSDRQTVTVGPGQRWGNVYTTLDAYGVTVIGGRVSTVGVGGLILGGGYFYSSSEYGLAADNVKSFEVVLSDGTVTTASAQENPDLFWALKGGGPNFGIVTSYELNTVPVHEIWYEGFAFSNDQVPAIFDAYAAWQNSSDFDVKATASFIINLEATLLALVYSAPSNGRPAAFAPFDGVIASGMQIVPPTNGTVLSFFELVNSLSPVIPGGRHDYRAASSQVDAQLYKDVYNIWAPQAAAVNKATGANQTFAIQPFPKNLVQQGILKGGNPLGMPLENFQAWTSVVDWTNTAQDAEVRSVSIETTEAWQQLSQERGLAVNLTYMTISS